MKIHSVELRHVRQIKELAVDLSAPLTVIGGPNGVGKTTLQQAILAAMFLTAKEMRESFVSRFDPDSAPTVHLGLSQGEQAPTIFLRRILLDDKGEWQEGATILKKKKQALDKIQEVLPISADAAALLLWGRQDDLPAVLDSFPSDGHSLLTAATIKGSGPDPKEIMNQLDKDIDNARKGERGGVTVGPLTQARKKLKLLEDELEQARSADDELRHRRTQLAQSKSQRDQVKNQASELEAAINQLAQLEKLIESALKSSGTLAQLVETQSDWGELEEEIATGRKALANLDKEREQLLAQYRVARHEELSRQIEDLGAGIKAAEELESVCTDLDTELKTGKRPEPADVKALQKLQSRIKEARDKMEATGVRYKLAAGAQPRTVRVAEDGGPEKEIRLVPDEIHQGIVGRVTIELDGLRFSAAGKEDISGLKAAADTGSEEVLALLKKFEADNETRFLSLAKEKEELKQALERKRGDLQFRLGGSTLAALKGELERMTAARTDNKMTLQDQEACAGKNLPPANEIKAWGSEKRVEISQARDSLAALEEKRPTEPEKELHRRNLENIRKVSRESAAAFTDALHREPTRELQEAIRGNLAKSRQEQARLAAALLEAQTRVADLAGQLKQAQPHRPLDDIQVDLEEAKEAFNREEVLQEARALLRERIEAKMTFLAADVPVELGKKVTQHLSRLSAGSFNRVSLSQGLAIENVGEDGVVQPWQPGQLSYGERHQAGLAVKIAVARALAETSGPVFVILDDSLVTFDPRRRAATEDFLIDLTGDEKIQVILLTCHSDWAADWKQRQPEQVCYIELAKAARYYREPSGIVPCT